MFQVDVNDYVNWNSIPKLIDQKLNYIILNYILFLINQNLNLLIAAVSITFNLHIFYMVKNRQEIVTLY